MVNSSISPPTDNLYKFVAVAGLVLVIIGVLLIAQVGSITRDITITLLEQEAGFKKAQVAGSFLEERSNAVSVELNRKPPISSSLSSDSIGVLRSQIRFLRSSEAAARRNAEELEAIAAGFDSLALDAGKALADFNMEMELVDQSMKDSMILIFLGFGLILFGAGTTLTGFRLWSTRVQRYEDILARVAAVEAQRRL